LPFDSSEVRMITRALFLLVAASSLSCAPGTPRAAHSPAEITERTWSDERGQAVRLSTWRGTPLVVTMLYRACVSRCPMTLAKLRRVEAAFAAAGRPVGFVLVTLDPRNDTPARLANYKRSEGLDDASWHLLGGDDESTKALSDFLRLRAFRDDTHIEHDVRVAVFDGSGRLARRFEGWSFAEADVLEAAGK
jgi:protein SCO1/2